MATPSADGDRRATRYDDRAAARRGRQPADALADKIVRSLDRAGHSSEWWRTPLALTLADLAHVGPPVLALAGIAVVLDEGEDPMWAVGGVTVKEALAVVQEWLQADIEAGEVGDWLRAGCWRPRAARCLLDVGLTPARLLDANQKPGYWVESSRGEEVPIASAVADGDLTPKEAAQLVVGPSMCAS